MIHPDSSPAAFSLGPVALTVNDLDLVRTYYEGVIGLHLLLSDGETARLGTQDQVLLELRRDPAARRRSNREAGLFHTAFLLPERSDLARWTHHALTQGVIISGASDHAVSEALYLSDPEGNGIEIYADRDPAIWTWQHGQVHMVTERLDLDSLLAATDNRPWVGVPVGSVVGHVHLQVGDLPSAEAFYAGLLGLDVTNRYDGAVFYAAGGYHHHLATNIWKSRGAERQNDVATGLAEVQIRLDPRHAQAIQSRAGDGVTVLHDPWGSQITLDIA